MQFLLSTDQDYPTYEDLEQDLKITLQVYTQKPRGEVSLIVPLAKRSSHYDWIGNDGKIGYGSPSKNLVDAILSIKADGFEVMSDENENLLVTRYFDHDGTTTVTWRVVTKSNLNKHNFLRQYGSHKEYINYLQERPAIKIKK